MGRSNGVANSLSGSWIITMFYLWCATDFFTDIFQFNKLYSTGTKTTVSTKTVLRTIVLIV